MIDGIAAMADGLITVLREHSGKTVDLEATPATRTRGHAAPGGRPRTRPRSAEATTVKRATGRRRTPRSKQAETSAPMSSTGVPTRGATQAGATPSEKMVAYAKSLANSKNVPLPTGFDTDFGTCRRFLDQHAR